MNPSVPTPSLLPRGRRLGAMRAGLFLATLTFCTFSSAEAEVPAGATEARRETQAFLERWNDAMAAQDAPIIHAFYVDDPRFRWFEDGLLRYRAVGEILGALKQFPPGSHFETSLSEMEAEWLAPGLIQGSAKFRTRVTMPGNSFAYGGVFTFVLERAGTDWKFLRGHTSTVRPERTR